MDENVMLTTFDNRFNPFTQFDAWWKEDLRLGHDCCGVLAKAALCNNAESDQMNERKIAEAIDEIVRMEPTIYRKAAPSDYE